MTSKKPTKPVLVKKTHQRDAPPDEVPQEAPASCEDSEEYRAFNDLASIVFRVPKSEIDEVERKEKKRKKAKG